MPTLRKANKNLKRIILIVVVLCFCVGCDQATKTVAKGHLPSSQPVYVIGDVFLFQYEENPGSFLGLGTNLSHAIRFWLLIVLVGLVLVGALGLILFSPNIHPVNVIAASLVIGGGLSNLVDRLLNEGMVVDFMNVGIGSVRTGVFNLADVAIMVGGGLAVVWNAFLADARIDTRGKAT